MQNERIELHADAILDARNAWKWYKRRSSSAADGFMRELDPAMALIEQSPTQWPGHRYGTRRFVLRRFPFSLVYRILPDESILIVAVAHGRRRPDYWYERD